MMAQAPPSWDICRPAQSMSGMRGLLVNKLLFILQKSQDTQTQTYTAV